MKVPGVTGLKRVLNESVVKALFDKTKERADYHPDYFRLNFTTNMALHCEIDETSTNEDDHNRLQEIAHQAGCGWVRTYYFRVMAHLDKDALALFRQKRNQNGKYYVIKSRGKSILDELAT